MPANCVTQKKWINSQKINLPRLNHEEIVNLNRPKTKSYATTQINLEYILVNEISQMQKDKYCVIPLI